MKVLIFENEVYLIENTFKTINLLYYDDSLDITYAMTSQEVYPIQNLANYDLIIVDIDLSSRSKKDGIAILQDIKDFNADLLNRAFVLTGSTKIKDKLISLGLETVKVINKPSNYEEIYSEMNKLLATRS